MIPFRDDNPTRTFPIVVVALLAANVVVHIYKWALPGEQQLVFHFTYGAIPAVLLGQETVQGAVERVLAAQFRVAPVEVQRSLAATGLTITAVQPIWLTIFTSMFLHGGLGHLGGNMLYLWIFGNNIEDVLGHFRFLVFYLFCGLVAAGAQILLSISSPVPMIGASGAIAGVLGAYYVKFPHARVYTLVFLLFFVTVIALPAALVLLFWFLGQVLLSLQHGGTGGVAVFAHIGGFVAGWALLRRFEPRRRRIRLDWWGRG